MYNESQRKYECWSGNFCSFIILSGMIWLKVTNVLEHDVKKLETTWFESPFADGIEATVVITWIKEEQNLQEKWKLLFQ